MTEIDTMKHAKMYIDKLSQGINPLDNSCIDDCDIVRNERISRCLTYVSGLIEQCIDKNIKSERRASKIEFFITDEQKAMLTPRDECISPSAIAEEINRVTVENGTKTFKATWINTWLIRIDMLYIDKTRKNRKTATLEGEEIGIVEEKRVAKKSGMEYFANLFTKEAQTFIYDNIDSIIECHYNPDEESEE